MISKSPRPFSMNFGMVGNVAQKIGMLARVGVRGACRLFSMGWGEYLGGWDGREAVSGSAHICVCGTRQLTITLSMRGPDLPSLSSLPSQRFEIITKKQRLKGTKIWEGRGLSQ